MAGLCVEKLPHSCGTSDALQVFQGQKGEYTGYCFACGTFVANPYGDKPEGYKPVAAKQSVSFDEQRDEIEAYPTIDLKDRHLKKEYLEYFGVKIALSEQDGETPVIHYYPHYKNGVLTAYLARFVPRKTFWAIGKLADADLFGWNKALQTGARRLFITEGQLDAVALFQALKEKEKGTKYEGYNPAVVSLPNGAQSAKNVLSRMRSEIQAAFKEVVLVFDQDDPGKAATAAAMTILPNARSTTLPAKDPNEAVIKGFSRALCNAVLFNADRPKNTRVIKAQTVYEAGRQQAKYGLSYPWDGLTKLTKGMRFGETYYLGAGVKMGKSTIRSALASHLIKAHGLKVFMAAPEEANAHTYRLMCSQMVGKIFHDPDVPFDYPAYDEASKIIGDNLYLLNLYQHMGWESLKNDVIVAANEGCKAIFIDPITNLTNGVSAGETNTLLQDIAQELAVMALDFGLIIWMFCHLKAAESGDSHERGGKVFSHQFAGSRAMMRSCHMMVGLEGNKDPDLDEEERNIRRLVVLEDRQFGSSGVVRLFYNRETGLYSEIK